METTVLGVGFRGLRFRGLRFRCSGSRVSRLEVGVLGAGRFHMLAAHTCNLRLLNF